MSLQRTIRRTLLWLLDKTQQHAKEPFGGYYTTGIKPDGQCPIHFVWNKAFIVNLRQFGYECETEEETIELFYIATRPTAQVAEATQEPVASEEHPKLSSESHFFRQ